MFPNGFVLDTECDNLYLESTKMWMLCIKDINNPDNKLSIYPFKDKNAGSKFIKFISQYDNPIIAFHYGLGYDIFVIRKFLGLDFSVEPSQIAGIPCTFIDTLYLSQYLQPDLQGHSLDAWGERLGLAKIDFHDFSQYSKEMDVYCERDVDLNILLFKKLWREFSTIYDVTKGLPEHFKCGQKSHYLMSCQEFTGFKFDVPLAESLVVKIQEMMLEIENDVLPQLPPRRLKKCEEKLYTMPVKPFKKDGSISSHMENFLAKHDGVLLENGNVLIFDKEYPVESGKMLDVTKPMLLGNQDDLKDWFLEMGWQPTFYNFKKDANGKPIRSDRGALINTTPKIQEMGKICPNLENLQGDLPKKVVKWLSLRNRLATLQGWLSNKRIAIDGRLPASRTGITPTHRQKHSVVVNVPKASEKVLLGKEFRSLFTVEDGNVLVAVDMSGLEGRVEGHYTFKYDGGARAEVILNGDIHSNNAKIFYPVETRGFDTSSPDFKKDDPKFKPYRDASKGAAYGLAYGCSPSKLATILGKSESEGKRLYDAFWDGNPALKALKEAVEKVWETNSKKWLPAIDGRRLITRKKNALINQIFQSAGAIAMDYAICFLDRWFGGICFDKHGKPFYNYKGYIVRRVAYMHDELEFECHPDIAEDVKQKIEKAYKMSGQYLKFNVPLVGDGCIGLNWREVHG